MRPPPTLKIEVNREVKKDKSAKNAINSNDMKKYVFII
jgi:hypothetical protein